MTEVIVIAAGEGSRWGEYGGTPKHLVLINGERLIDRTARLFSEHGRVTVVGRDARYKTPWSELFIPAIDDLNYGADKFLSSRELWNRDGRTLVVYGDAYFSEAAVRLVGAWEPHDWYLFARFGPSSVYGGDRGECFVQSFWPRNIPDHLAALLEIVSARRQKHIHEAGGWQHYRAMEGLFLDEHAKGARFVEIDDETDDLDYPEDYARIRLAAEGGIPRPPA